jgi:quinol monooxygenase YgiN
MENSTITNAKTLLVSFTAKDRESSQELKNALNYLADMSRHEKGILRYEVFRSDNNELEYYVLETWSSERALENHLSQPYVHDFAYQCKLLLQKPFSIVPLGIPFTSEWLKPMVTNSISLN